MEQPDSRIHEESPGWSLTAFWAVGAFLGVVVLLMLLS